MTTLQGLRCIDELELANLRVFVRLDLDCPVEDDKVTDDTRIAAILPTLKVAMDAGARVVVASHRGRPKGRATSDNGLMPIGVRLAELSGWEVFLPDDCIGEAPRKALSDLRAGQLMLLENLRFNPGEEANEDSFARELLALTDVYVNDALSASNRSHASVQALPRLVPQRAIGLQLKRELEALDRVINPQGAFVAYIGGTRLAERAELLTTALNAGRTICVGGSLAATLLSAQGKKVGATRVDAAELPRARTLLDLSYSRDAKLLLPVDVVVAERPDAPEGRVVDVTAVPDDAWIVDIGPRTLEQFAQLALRAQTALWVGAMGNAGHPAFAAGTVGIAKLLSSTTAYAVAIGAATVSAARQLGEGTEALIGYVSVGSGAALELLEGRKLPGIEVLRMGA